MDVPPGQRKLAGFFLAAKLSILAMGITIVAVSFAPEAARGHIVAMAQWTISAIAGLYLTLVGGNAAERSMNRREQPPCPESPPPPSSSPDSP